MNASMRSGSIEFAALSVARCTSSLVMLAPSAHLTIAVRRVWAYTIQHPQTQNSITSSRAFRAVHEYWIGHQTSSGAYVDTLPVNAGISVMNSDSAAVYSGSVQMTVTWWSKYVSTACAHTLDICSVLNRSLIQ